MNRAQAWDVETGNYRLDNGECEYRYYEPTGDEHWLSVRTHEGRPFAPVATIERIKGRAGGPTQVRAPLYEIMTKAMREEKHPVRVHRLHVLTGKSAELIAKLMLEMQAHGMVQRTGQLRGYEYSLVEVAESTA